jgi:cell division transport system permease protein
MKNYFARHVQELKKTLKTMLGSLGSTLIAAVILGVAISLPIMLFKITESMSLVAGQWNDSNEVTVFVTNSTIQELDQELVEQTYIDVGYQILQIPSVRDVKYISPDQALESFKSQSNFGDLLDELEQNPLPAMMIVYPENDLTELELTELVNVLAQMDNVDSVSFDQQWRQRFQAIISVFNYAVLILVGMMATGAVLIISNTVRLSIVGRQEEIQIIDQIGGTAAFIRRPFLYLGALQGISGAVVALVIAFVALDLLGKPVNQLAQLYSSQFRIAPMDFVLCGWIMFLSTLLGWTAARFTVGSYIRKMRISALGR